MHPRIAAGAMPFAAAGALLLILFLQIDRAASQVSTPTVIISEVAWAGTQHSAADEWIELYNTTGAPVDLDGWRLRDSSGDVDILLQGQIASEGFFLLERTADDTVSDVAADQIYVGGLNNGGESLTLVDAQETVVDSANIAGGAWPAGRASPDYISMERASLEAPDDAAGWVDNDGAVVAGLDAGGNPIRGTPRAANAAWIATPGDGHDLAVSITVPPSVTAGSHFELDLALANAGDETATEIVLTATLPEALQYVSDDSGLAVDLSNGGSPVWHIDSLAAGAGLSFAVELRAQPWASGSAAIELRVVSNGVDSNPNNNEYSANIDIVPQSGGALLVSAVYYDGYELGDADEAIELFNRGSQAVALNGWTVSNGRREATIAGPIMIESNASLWLARDGAAFARQFGYAPDLVLAPWPGFANNGDEVVLFRPDGSPADVMVYKDGDASALAWQGATVQPYRGSGLFAEEGQILFRRRDEVSGLPVPDTDSERDWAQTMTDGVEGRKVRYPGWSYDALQMPAVSNSTHALTVAVAPDNAYQLLAAEIGRARESIYIESLTFENVAVGEALNAAAARGVDVIVLLEGAPVAGIDDHERYICQSLEANGGACWFMVRDDGARVHDRYRYLHAKFMVIDEMRALISSENLSPFSLPDDDKADGTWGRRGLVLATEAPHVVQRLLQIFFDDFDPAAHVDLLRWHEADAVYGAPPDTFVPITVTGGTTYTTRFLQPERFDDVASMGLYHAPENILRRSDGLLALLNQAGPGDTVLVQQLTERVHWGAAGAGPETDPNPRLQAYIDAARRGAVVRILLDSHFDADDEPLSNAATCAYVKQIAAMEGLRITCALANPTGLGIHNKMVLLQLGGKGWLHAGSWNGTEQATKGNREVALQVQSDAAYEYLAALFEYDWPHQNWLPLITRQSRGPAHYPLLSEIMYDPPGADDGEYIEINNPTFSAVDLSGWVLSDAVLPTDFEDARAFPAGTILPGRGVIVVALSAAPFMELFGFAPDFEVLDSRPDVSDMVDDGRWGDPAALLQLGNMGDELLLRAPGGEVVDVVAYGAGHYPGTTSCALVDGVNAILERAPFWHDSDDCAADFRAWPFPSPGWLP